MRKPILLTAAAALIATAAPAVQAQDAPAAGSEEAQQMSPEQLANLRRSAVILRAFTVAFQSEQVQQPVKGKLLACMYNNKLAAISTATGQVLANNPNLDADKPGDVYRAAAGVCGILFKKVDGSEDAAPAPAPSNNGADSR